MNAIELAKDLETNGIGMITRKLIIAELRRLAEIERKYNEIMAQEPIGKISHLDRRNYGGKISYLVEFHSKDRLIVGTELYTLPRTSHD